MVNVVNGNGNANVEGTNDIGTAPWDKWQCNACIVNEGVPLMPTHRHLHCGLGSLSRYFLCFAFFRSSRRSLAFDCSRHSPFSFFCGSSGSSHFLHHAPSKRIPHVSHLVGGATDPSFFWKTCCPCLIWYCFLACCIASLNQKAAMGFFHSGNTSIIKALSLTPLRTTCSIMLNGGFANIRGLFPQNTDIASC